MNSPLGDRVDRREDFVDFPFDVVRTRLLRFHRSLQLTAVRADRIDHLVESRRQIAHFGAVFNGNLRSFVVLPLRCREVHRVGKFKDA